MLPVFYGCIAFYPAPFYLCPLVHIAVVYQSIVRAHQDQCVGCSGCNLIRGHNMMQHYNI